MLHAPRHRRSRKSHTDAECRCCATKLQRRWYILLHQAGRSLYAYDLTPREQEIIGCLAAMLSNKEICERLKIHKETLHVYLVKLYKKLGVHSRRQAARKLLRAAHRLTISQPFIVMNCCWIVRPEGV